MVQWWCWPGPVGNPPGKSCWPVAEVVFHVLIALGKKEYCMVIVLVCG
jgi:hypothetical protein